MTLIIETAGPSGLSGLSVASVLPTVSVRYWTSVISTVALYAPPIGTCRSPTPSIVAAVAELVAAVPTNVHGSLVPFP